MIKLTISHYFLREHLHWLMYFESLCKMTNQIPKKNLHLVQLNTFCILSIFIYNAYLYGKVFNDFISSSLSFFIHFSLPLFLSLSLPSTIESQEQAFSHPPLSTPPTLFSCMIHIYRRMWYIHMVLTL